MNMQDQPQDKPEIKELDAKELDAKELDAKELDAKEKEEIEKFQMELALQFIKNNKSGLLEIYLKHSRGTSENEGEGILIINLKEDVLKSNNVDVSYAPYSCLSPDLVSQFLKLKEENDNEHIIYIMVTSIYMNQIIQLDIRTLK
jgi:hypothetical protein